MILIKTPYVAPRYSRRRLLRQLGLGGALLPFLDLELEARAATTPLRFATMVWPNGVTRAWWPTGSETDFTLGAAMKSLQPIKDHIIIADEFKLQAFNDEKPGDGGHTSFRWLLTGGGGNLSVDQHIANVNSKRFNTPIHSLVIGVDNKEETKPPLKWISFNPGSVPYEDDPYRLYKKLFGDATPGAAKPAVPDEALLKLRAQKRSVLDWVGKDVARFMRDLGATDRQKIDAHLTSVREIEKQLDVDAPAPTVPVGPPAVEQGLNPYEKKNYDKLCKIQLDMVVAALTANQTSVVSMCWNSSHNNVWVFHWLGKEFTEPGRGEFNRIRNHHEISHHAGGGDDHRRKNLIDDWFMSQLTYLALELGKRKEGNGTVLDNSLLLWANCMEDGGAHSTGRMPWVLAGRAGGAVKPGRWIKGGRAPHNRLLAGIANAMGAPAQTFGPAKYGDAITNL